MGCARGFPFGVHTASDTDEPADMNPTNPEVEWTEQRYFSPLLVVTRYLVATPSFSRSETVKSPVSSPSASAVRDWTLSSGASSAASALVESKKTKEKAAAVAMILGVMRFFLG